MRDVFMDEENNFIIIWRILCKAIYSLKGNNLEIYKNQLSDWYETICRFIKTICRKSLRDL